MRGDGWKVRRAPEHVDLYREGDDFDEDLDDELDEDLDERPRRRRRGGPLGELEPGLVLARAQGAIAPRARERTRAVGNVVAGVVIGAALVAVVRWGWGRVAAWWATRPGAGALEAEPDVEQLEEEREPKAEGKSEGKTKRKGGAAET